MGKRSNLVLTTSWWYGILFDLILKGSSKEETTQTYVYTQPENLSNVRLETN